MIRYTVVWTDEATEELAAIWSSSRNRNQVTAASHGLDKRLRDDPESVGIRAGAKYWTCALPPLEVLYQISEQIGSFALS